MKTLPAHYFIRVRNFGDRITPLLIEKLAGKVPKYTDINLPHILGCGSLLQAANTNSIVWGSGFISSTMCLPKLRKGSVSAIRGHLSFNRLKQNYRWIKNIPLGDPGTLLPKVYHPDRQATFDFGILPHYVDLADPFVKYCEDQGGLIIDPQRDVLEVVDDILSCKKILSSSLHGLILSDAYEIENHWINLSTKVVGDGFKFRDYFTTRVCPLGYYEPSVMSMYKEGVLREALGKCTVTKPKYDIEDLYDVFPNEISCTNEHIALQRTSTYKQHASLPVPIFIVYKGNLKGLEQLLRTLQYYKREMIPVICNCSEYRLPIQKYLDKSKITSIPVYNCCEIAESGRKTIKITEVIDRYFQQYSEPVNYLVTDCDHVIEDDLASKLYLFEKMLNLNYMVDCVSCDDSTNSNNAQLGSLSRRQEYYTEKTKVSWNGHHYRWRNQTIHCSEICAVHTEFALYRAGYKYMYENRGIKIRLIFE